MVTAYDYPSAQVAEEAGVDIVLVGDSGAMTVLGHDSTVPVGMDEMLMLAAAVRRGLKTPLLVGDMPFGSYESSNEQAIANAQRFVKEAGCDAVKLERGGASVDRARAIIRAGIPVMGHVGLTPQTATALGGYKAQGRTGERAAKIAEDAFALQAVGCFAIVFEAIPAAVTEAMMPQMEIPVIGIGAGPVDRRPGARLPRPARHLHRPHGPLRQALRRHPRGDGRGRRRLRRGRPRGPLPRGLAHLLDRPRGARAFADYLDQDSLAGQLALGSGSRPSGSELRADRRVRGALVDRPWRRCRSSSSFSVSPPNTPPWPSRDVAPGRVSGPAAAALAMPAALRARAPGAVAVGALQELPA